MEQDTPIKPGQFVTLNRGPFENQSLNETWDLTEPLKIIRTCGNVFLFERLSRPIADGYRAYLGLKGWVASVVSYKQ